MKCKSYERNETSIEGHALTTCIVSKGVAWRQMRKWNPARGAHIKSQLNCRLERACHVFSYNIDEKEKKKRKKASGCVSYKTDTNWRGTRWQDIWLLEWYFSQWRILNRFRSLLEIFSDFFYHIWLNIFFPRLLLLAKRAVVSSIQEQFNEGKWKNWVKINKLF